MGFTYAYVYGLPEDAQLVEQVKSCAKAGAAVKFAKGMKIALIGPRQTCRVAGTQDMTVEEWNFLKMTGVTFIYFEMEEVPDEAKEISDEEARMVLDLLHGRTAQSLAASHNGALVTLMDRLFIAGASVESLPPLPPREGAVPQRRWTACISISRSQACRSPRPTTIILSTATWP